MVGNHLMTFRDLVFLLTQVSVVGVVRRSAHYDTNVQYCVDDMTGAPLLVKQWVAAEASNRTGFLRAHSRDLVMNR